MQSVARVLVGLAVAQSVSKNGEDGEAQQDGDTPDDPTA
jgi:hypothetical protein